MLILSRKIGEKIYIGDSIVLTVLGYKNERVRLGFEAPADVRILRGEIRYHAEETPQPCQAISGDRL